MVPCPYVWMFNSEFASFFISYHTNRDDFIHKKLSLLHRERQFYYLLFFLDFPESSGYQVPVSEIS